MINIYFKVILLTKNLKISAFKEKFGDFSP